MLNSEDKTRDFKGTSNWESGHHVGQSSVPPQAKVTVLQGVGAKVKKQGCVSLGLGSAQEEGLVRHRAAISYQIHPQPAVTRAFNSHPNMDTNPLLLESLSAT